MEVNKTTIALCVAIFLIIGINATLYVAIVRNKRTISQLALFKKAANRAHKPWKDEEDNLEELSRLVKNLQKHNQTKDEETLQ